MGSPGLEAQPKPFPEGIANWEPQSGVTSLGAKQNSIPPNSWVPTGQRDGVKKAGSFSTLEWKAVRAYDLPCHPGLCPHNQQKNFKFG